MNIKMIGAGIAAWAVMFVVFALCLKGLVDWKLMDAKNVGVAVIGSSIFLFLIVPKLISILSSEDEFSSSMMINSMLVGGVVTYSITDSFWYALLFMGFAKGLEACGFFKAMHRGIGWALGSSFVAVVGKKPKKHYI